MNAEVRQADLDVHRGGSSSLRDRLGVALDVPTLERATALYGGLAGDAGVAKVGLELWAAAGPATIDPLRDLGGRVFLDLKLHDIPTTVGRACAVLAGSGAAFVNVHAAGGAAMVRAAADGLASGPEPPALLAVTVLTSEADALPGLVEERAALALDAGAVGLVCGAPDLALLRPRFPDAVLLVPGTRPPGADRHDQGRTASPAEALDGGADVVVLGRPVTAAEDPARALGALVGDLRASSH